MTATKGNRRSKSWFGWFITAGVLVNLVGCPGEESGVSAPSATSQLLLSGTASHGISGEVYAEPVRVRGVRGVDRSVTPIAGSGQFSVNLSGLTGPFALRVGVLPPNTDPPARVLHGLAIKDGVVNITPLTSLLIARLTGKRPEEFFAALQSTDISFINDTAIQQAQLKVVDYLQQVIGVEVRSGPASFLETPFVRSAGDAMYDTIVALEARLNVLGTTLDAVIEDLVLEIERCAVENVVLSSGGITREFCPIAKQAQQDETDASVIVHRFTNDAGDALSLRVRDSSVLSVEYQPAAGGALASCSGSVCSGVTLGVPAGDLTRAIVFAATPLASATQTLVLSGTLTSAVPGIVLPPLPCTSNRYFIIKPDRTVIAACVDSDSAGIGLPGTFATQRGLLRRVFTYADTTGAFPPQRMEIVTQGDSVLSALVWDDDPVTALPRPLYKCRGSDCAGISLGPVVIDGSFGIDIAIRTITLADTVLRVVNADGTLTASDTVSVKASFDALVAEANLTPPHSNLLCASSAENVEVLLSDTTPLFDVCPPADPMGFGPFSSSSLDGVTGNLSMAVANLGSNPDGSFFQPAEQVNLEVTAAGNVVSVTFTSRYGSETFRCVASACVGVTVSDPDASGQRTVNFTDTVLGEIETGQLLGDRSATLNGSFIAPPP